MCKQLQPAIFSRFHEIISKVSIESCNFFNFKHCAIGENSRLKSLIWKVQSFWKMVITNTLLKTLNKLLETKILTEFQHSNFKLDRTWAPWFLLYGDSHLIKFEILGHTLYKLAIKLEYKLEKGIETITWYLFEPEILKLNETWIR